MSEDAIELIKRMESRTKLEQEITSLRSRVEELEREQKQIADNPSDPDDIVVIANNLRTMRLLSDNANLQAELARLREKVRWIPVGERLPDICTDVIVGGEYFVGVMNLMPDKSRWVNEFGTPYHEDSITHWMPLPSIPGGEE